ncbi:ArsR/SmtB family transcription factor [Humibacter sp.]|uniref:ArsR/SmtB family transcription factor n=1 Tax=Humibacter sp. TaxID=1940291 RepID=UPI003F7E4DC6
MAAADPDRFDEAGSTETDVLKAVVEPRRRAILRLVATSELSAGEIARSFDVSRPAISQHLTVLKDAGLLTERRDGTRRLYRTRAEGLAGLRGFLDELWGTALADAARIAEAEPEATATPDAVAAPRERRREAR